MSRIHLQCGWCEKDLYVVPSRVERNKNNFCSRICLAKFYNKIRSDQANKVKFKSCGGIIHKGKLVPIEKFYRRGPDLVRSQCQDCEKMSVAQYRTDKGKGGTYIPIGKIWWATEELVQKLGVINTCKRIGISTQTYYQWKNRKGSRNSHRWRMKKTNAQKIIKLLAEVRKGL